MLVIGLTGGIGTGKSTVSDTLAKLGAVIINADQVGHQAFEPHTEVWRDVVLTFGKDIVRQNDEIDRRKLGEIVFNDPSALSRLNKIMHPRMYRMMRDKIEELRKQGVEVVVLEAAILIEAKWTSLVDTVWVTTAPEATVIQRLSNRDGLAEEQILARMQSQMPSEERAKYADVVINTDCTLEEVKEKVKELWNGLHSSKEMPA